MGLSIGNVYCGVPTVADDLLFLSRSIIDLRAILSSQGYFAGLERYIISETKTKVSVANSPIDTDTYLIGTKMEFSQLMVKLLRL